MNGASSLAQYVCPFFMVQLTSGAPFKQMFALLNQNMINGVVIFKVLNERSENPEGFIFVQGENGSSNSVWIRSCRQRFTLAIVLSGIFGD